MIKSLALSLLASGMGIFSSVALAEPSVERLKTHSGETIELVLINHGSIAIRYKEKNLYVDPVEVKGRCSYKDMPKADCIFITHDHFDHLDEPTIAAIAMTSTAETMTYSICCILPFYREPPAFEFVCHPVEGRLVHLA